MTKKILRVLLLSDGLPGHANQSRGLVNWLSDRYFVECQELNIKLYFKGVARLLLPWILHHHYSPRVISWFYYLPSEITAKPDVIISAGGNTSFLNVMLAKKWKTPNIFLGSGRRLRSDNFTAHLTLEPTNQPHNIVMDLAPTLIEPNDVLNKGKQLRQSLGINNGQKLYLLALGGDGAGYRYDDDSCKQIATLMQNLSLRDNCRWLLTTSRRTGASLEVTLKQLLPSELLVDAVWWSQNPRKVMSAYMGAADMIFISIDSMSMISEAIYSGKPTTVLQPKYSVPEERYENALNKLQKSNYCIIHPLDNPHPPSISGTNKLLDFKGPLLDLIDNALINFVDHDET